MEDLHIQVVIPGEIQSKNKAFGHAVIQLKDAIRLSELKGDLSELGDIQLVTEKDAISFLGAKTEAGFNALLREYKNEMGEKVEVVRTKPLTETRPRLLYREEQIRRVRNYLSRKNEK